MQRKKSTKQKCICEIRATCNTVRLGIYIVLLSYWRPVFKVWRELSRIMGAVFPIRKNDGIIDFQDLLTQRRSLPIWYEIELNPPIFFCRPRRLLPSQFCSKRQTESVVYSAYREFSRGKFLKTVLSAICACISRIKCDMRAEGDGTAWRGRFFRGKKFNILFARWRRCYTRTNSFTPIIFIALQLRR